MLVGEDGIWLKSSNRPPRPERTLQSVTPLTAELDQKTGARDGVPLLAIAV
jgi:hypothetical protein